MKSRFTDQVVLVTGAGSGIGRDTAQAFAAEGATVIVGGRNQERLRQTVKLIEAAGGTAETATVDVTDENRVRQLVTDIAATHGRLDVAVNNAGILAAGPVADMDLRAWKSMLDTNVTGVLLSLKHQIAQMRSQAGGTIVNIGSTVGAHASMRGMAAYGATKAAVSALSRAAALENIAHGVRINVVSPGSSDTPMSMRPGETTTDRAERVATAVPLGRVGKLREVSAAVLWLASAESGFAVGHDLVVDGGASL